MFYMKSFSAVTLVLSAAVCAATASVSAESAVKAPPIANTKAGSWDDSIKPVDPNNNSKASGFDDSVRPIGPSRPPVAVQGNEASATAIEYGKTAAPEAKKSQTSNSPSDAARAERCPPR